MTLYVELAQTFKYCLQVIIISLEVHLQEKKSHLKSFFRELLRNNLYFSKVKVSSVHFNRYSTNKKTN